MNRLKPRTLALIGVVLAIIVARFISGQLTTVSAESRQSVPMQIARSLELLEYQYAIDHNGNYPEGKSSTEIFQKLLDEKYIKDATFFYFPLPGKTKPAPGAPLKPENVSWDVTCCLKPDDSDEIPAVYLTGFRIDYRPGGSAVPLLRPWYEWLLGTNEPNHGIAVCYKSHFAKIITPSSSNGVVLNFIRPDADFHGKTYRQLTPDGPLP